MPRKRPKNDISSTKITDSRFTSFQTDPRYALPSTGKTKVNLDKRFRHVLTDSDFSTTAKVDRYGRKLNTSTKKKALQRLYRQEDEDVEQRDDHIDEPDNDKDVQKELQRVKAKYDPARGGGFSASESESDSEDDGDEDSGIEADASADMLQFRNEEAAVPTGDVTKRIAVVNMDWDYIRSVDLLACFSSFIAPGSGSIEKVSIYKSDFGKEREEQENLEGPVIKKAPAEMNPGDSETDSEDEDGDEEAEDEKVKKSLTEEGDDQEVDNTALRKYQLERLRYYYAVVVFSDEATAEVVYKAADGLEYESSSNLMDLRFVPDDVDFDDLPRDEAHVVPAGYKPPEFVTKALQSSKVELTWDIHPEELARKETIQKAFSGSRADIAENDLMTYLASGSGESEPEPEDLLEDEKTDEPKLSKKELARRKMRQALGLGDEPAPKSTKSGPVGDMQITFTPALSEISGGTSKDGIQETTVEKYMRKEKERKEKRRQKAKAARAGVDADEDAGDDTGQNAGQKAATAEEDLGFDDDFFTLAEPVKVTKSSIRKEERRRKREAREAEEKDKAAEKAQLELLMADNTNEGTVRGQHFDMNQIIRVEKRKGKKKKHRKEIEDQGGLQDDFRMDVHDPRFQDMFEKHEFAIDPSDPRLKATPGMKALLEERRKRKLGGGDLDLADSPRDSKKGKVKHGDVAGLAQAVKRKAKHGLDRG